MAASRTSAQHERKPKENQYLFNLGVRGRKTGLTLPDTGIRDENGLEPMDNLFSSPAKPKAQLPKKVNGIQKNVDATISSEEDMDVGESTIPEPEVILQKRASIRLPPRSKSPIKTFLQSPARRNPSLGPVSSPTRGSIVAPRAASVSASVRRKLDFSATEDSTDDSTAPKKRAESALPLNGTSRLSSGTHLRHLKQPIDRDNTKINSVDSAEIDEAGEDSYQILDGENGEDSFQMVESRDDEPLPQDEEMNEVEEPEHEAVPELQAAKKIKRKAIEPVDSEGPGKRGRGRPKKNTHSLIEEDAELEEPAEEEQSEPPTKRSRKSIDTAPRVSKKQSTRPQKTAEVAEPSKKAKGGSRKSGEATNAAKPKPKGRRPKLAPIVESDSPAISRGPPMPRNNRGLLILRRETPAGGAGFQQTRSGRNSIRPLAFWKNERVEYSEDENEDNFGKFLLPRIKEVVRADEVDNPKRHKSRSKPPKSKKRSEPKPESEEEEEIEPWETEDGRITGPIRQWDPEDPIGMDADEVDEEIALSSAAIITNYVSNGSFKFAKTLTLDFFGSGMVELMPGDQKKAKSSRKMQMVFFVHTGRVQVMVNEKIFRIGKGGMWQVPRGNFYSIQNDYDKPSRIFFAQGCELQEEFEETT